MYDFAVQFYLKALNLMYSFEFLFILCESLFELTCFNFIISSKKEKIIFNSDLYDLNLFHFKVRVFKISWRV
jgi:hypothetical protein